MAQAGRKTVRIEGRRADDGEQIAIARIDGDDRAARAGNRRLCCELKIHIEAQRDVPTRNGPEGLEITDRCGRRRGLRTTRRIEQHAALRVDDLLAVTDLTVKIELEPALDTGFADVRRRRILTPLDDLEIRSGNARDVADRMRSGLAVRIVPNQALANVDAGKLVPAHGEPGRLLVGQVTDHDVLEPPMRAHEASERVLLLGVNEPCACELGQRGVEVRHLLGRDHELPSGKVLGKHVAVSVVDETAGRRERLDAKTIALRQLHEQLVIDDLQLHETIDEDAREQEHDDRSRNQARQKKALLLPMIFEWDGRVHLSRLRIDQTRTCASCR